MNDIDPTPEQPRGETFFRRHRSLAIIGCAAALALAIAGGGIAVGANLASQQAASATTTQQYSTQPSAYQPQATTLAPTPATSAQQVGVVTILTSLYYQQDARAAGTGIVLSSGGEILTNNHVIQGATSIQVTVESTGQTYTAHVVGSDTVDDVAVLQLEGATGLATANIGSTQAAAVGDAVTSIGNAEGTGNLVAATGPVSAIDQSITVSSDVTGIPDTLYGLIEVNADVVSGDSGGPLLDAKGRVIGMVTAASSGQRNVTGFAITIGSALGVAQQIESGVGGGNVTIGLPAFLGVTLGQGALGTTIVGTVTGSAAASAGLVAGDTITAVDGTAVTANADLSALIAAHPVGDRVTVAYTDSTGAAQQVVVTLGEGPAA
jgi:S1-C subfamily serine protease